MGWLGSLVVALLVSGGGSESVALVGVGVVDMESGEVLPGQTVLIVGREIRAVASEGEVELPQGVTIVNAEGNFLIPGLWDTHVHVTPFGEGVLPLFVAYGVTAVRDVGSTDAIFRWREEIAAGARLGPRIWTSGRMLAQARGADPGPEWERVDSPAAARQAVAARRTEGADLLKMQDSFMERGLWSAAVAEATLHGLPVAGHAPVDVPLTEAIELGLGSTEQIVLALHRAGVTILAGTDAWAMYDFPGSDLHSELWHMVQAGLTPLEALRTATLTPAQYMRVADSVGSIRPGKLADLVLLDADPLADIRNTERIAAVVANGRYLDRPALDLLLAEARRVHQR